MKLRKQIAKLIATKKLSQDTLDELVVESFIDAATEVNNSGLKAQLAFLLTTMSEESLLDLLENHATGKEVPED